MDALRTPGRTLARSAADTLACLDRPRTRNGATEALHGHLDHLRGAAPGFRHPTHDIAAGLLEPSRVRPPPHPRS